MLDSNVVTDLDPEQFSATNRTDCFLVLILVVTRSASGSETRLDVTVNAELIARLELFATEALLVFHLLA